MQFKAVLLGVVTIISFSQAFAERPDPAGDASLLRTYKYKNNTKYHENCAMLAILGADSNTTEEEFSKLEAKYNRAQCGSETNKTFAQNTGEMRALLNKLVGDNAELRSKLRPFTKEILDK